MDEDRLAQAECVLRAGERHELHQLVLIDELERSGYLHQAREARMKLERLQQYLELARAHLRKECGEREALDVSPPPEIESNRLDV